MLPTWTLISFHLLQISPKLKCEMCRCYKVHSRQKRKPWRKPPITELTPNYQQVWIISCLTVWEKNWMFSKILSWVLSVVCGGKFSKWAWCPTVFFYRWNKEASSVYKRSYYIEKEGNTTVACDSNGFSLFLICSISMAVD